MRLSNFINKFIFSIVFISTSLAFLVSIMFQYINFEKEKLYIKAEFIAQKKNDLKKEIESVFNLIEKEEKSFERLQNKLKGNIDFEKIKEDNKNELLKWLANYETERNGYIFVNTLDNKALVYDGKKLEIFIGERQGRIAEEPRGIPEFGWDGIFIPENADNTWAEMDLDEKSKYSMKRLALEKLKDYLIENNK